MEGVVPFGSLNACRGCHVIPSLRCIWNISSEPILSWEYLEHGLTMMMAGSLWNILIEVVGGTE